MKLKQFSNKSLLFYRCEVLEIAQLNTMLVLKRCMIPKLLCNFYFTEHIPIKKITIWTITLELKWILMA